MASFSSSPSPARRRALLLGVIAAAVVFVLLYALPVSVRGQAVDEETGQPLAHTAVVLSNGQQATTDAQGRFNARSSRFAALTAAIDHPTYLPASSAAHFNLLPLLPAQLRVAAQPTVLQGQVVDALSSQPAAGVTVTAGDQRAVTDAQGRFELRRIPRREALLSLSGQGYIAYDLPVTDWDGKANNTASLPLYPNGLHGAVRDADTGEPLAGVQVMLNGQTTHSLANGFFYFADAAAGQISMTLPGYLPAVVQADSPTALDGSEAVDAALQPTRLSGVVSDGRTGQPLGGVALAVGGQTASSDAEGRYQFSRLVGDGLSLTSELEGYEPSQTAVDEQATLLDGAALDLTLYPPHLSGQVVNSVSQSPVVSATVTAGDWTAVTGSDGRFRLWTTATPLQVAVEATGYEPGKAEFTEDADLTVALTPKGVVVVVTDYRGNPVAGATVAGPRSNADTDAQGVAFLPLLQAGEVFTATAAHFGSMALAYDGAAEQRLTLQPDRVTGKVADAGSGKPVPGAVIYVYDGATCQGAACRGMTPALVVDAQPNGAFDVGPLPAQPQVMVKAPGYEVLFVDTLEDAGADCGVPYCLTAQLTPFEARGFYLPFHFLYDRALVLARLDLIANSADVNAVVVDMKSDYGEIAWQSQNPIAQKISVYQPDIMSAQEFLAEAQKRGIYTIARFVTFKDNALAEGKPEWALRLRSNPDVIWKDGENLSWADPYLPEVRSYEIDLARELSTLGFDEIQFDYFRFSGLRDHNMLTYSVESTAENRREAITTFARELLAALKPTGIFTSIDVFGSIILNGNEPYIGQNLADMAVGLDYLSPMIYPQVWWPGTFPGCDEPVLCPYKVIYDSTTTVRDIVPMPTRIRPWLQGYPKNFRTEGPAAGYDYAVPEMLIQRLAAENAAAEGWLFWSGGGRYPDEIFGPLPSLAELEAQVRARQGGRSGPY